MKFFTYIAVSFTVTALLVYGYINFWDEVYFALFGVQNEYTVYVGDVALSVTLADSASERRKGLSGVKELDETDGKLFLFDEAQLHGIWMKDMNFAIDIIWIDNDLEVVHIETDVKPESFPTIFAPREPARYVLETNAFFVDTYKIEVGDRVALPPSLVPFDVKERQLRNNQQLSEQG